MTPQPAKMDDLLRKLEPTPLRRGCRPQCCSLQIFKRAGVLLAFHALNVLVVIGGVISVVFLLASWALMPIWTVFTSIHDAIQRIEKKWLVYFWCAVLVVLYLVLLLINFNICVGLNLAFVAGSFSIFFRSASAIEALVKTDVKLANFVTTDDSNAHDPAMTRPGWITVIYFALLKLVIGVLSFAVLIISVVLPVLVLFSAGDASLFFGQSTFSDNPIIYSALVSTVWLVGVVGVSVVAVLSVKVTFWVCDGGQQQTEVETQSAIPVTPSPELTTTNFAEIDPSTPAVLDGAVAAV